MTVAHTEHTGSLDVFENHGEEFRRFGSEGSYYEVLNFTGMVFSFFWGIGSNFDT